MLAYSLPLVPSSAYTRQHTLSSHARPLASSTLRIASPPTSATFPSGSYQGRIGLSRSPARLRLAAPAARGVAARRVPLHGSSGLCLVTRGRFQPPSPLTPPLARLVSLHSAHGCTMRL